MVGLWSMVFFSATEKVLTVKTSYKFFTMVQLFLPQAKQSSKVCDDYR